MREPYEVIVTPVVTEKSTAQMEEGNVYTFVVSEKANKIDIARAVESLWDVTVEDVRTMRYAGKARRAFLGHMARNFNIGRRPSFKKAVVKLAEGDAIELYEMG
jgi:large subunit ribosomal protein L23